MGGERRVEEPAGALQKSLAWHDVADIAGMDLGDAEHQRRLRIDGAAHHPLQRHHELARRQHRIVAQMRHRGVGTGAPDKNRKSVHGRHHRPHPRADLPHGQARPVVDGIDRLHREALEKPVLDHAHAAALVLLGRLKDEMHGPREIAPLAQELRRPQQHRRVPVVAAGVHDTRHRRGVGHLRLFLDWQGIELGTQPDGTPTRATAQHAHHTRAADALVHLEAERPQPLRHERRRPMLAKAQLRLRVDQVAPGHDVFHGGRDRIIVQHLSRAPSVL